MINRIRIASDNTAYRNLSKHNQIVRLNRVYRDPRRTYVQYRVQANFCGP